MTTRFLTGLALAGLCLSARADAAPADHFLIVPGKSIGQTALGPNGAAELKHLPPPTVFDHAMMQSSLVWVSHAPGHSDTLYIHDISNSVLDKPTPGDSINEIRITSRQFHTPSGISTASTLAHIRRRFPNIRPVTGTPGLFEDILHGITFEFAPPATPASRCIAISVLKPLPGGSGDGLATQRDVDELLKDSQV